MPVPIIAAGIGAAGSLAAGAIGNKAAGDAAAAGRNASEAAYLASIKDLEAIGIPSIEAQKIVANQYKSAGQWTPELEQLTQQANSNLLGITTDPSYKASQLKALGQLQDIAANGGMTLSDRATQEKIMHLATN